MKVKLQVSNAEKQEGGNERVNMFAPYNENPKDENRNLSDGMPMANINLLIEKGKPGVGFFKPGKKYICEFTEVEQEPEEPVKEETEQ